ncbi:MAG: tetratricopeptide repeat protein [Bacteroidales bacterium]
MKNKANLLSLFWQELKRRKVIYVITVYASAAFVIIELINNIVEPLNLPERTPTFAIIILAIGFPVVVVISWLFDLTPKGIERTKPLEEIQEDERPVVQNRWQIATYISVAVIIGLIVLNLVGRPNLLKAGDIRSMVVLPFDNFTGDDQLENMVSGMHALLVGDMGRIGEMRVLGKTTSSAYRDAGISATKIASELGVDAVLETSVMCLGDTVCMQFRLVRTSGEEEQLWVGDFKEDKSQILNLYNRITKKVADEIMIELSPEEERLLAKSRTVDREAYDAYLRSYQYWDDVSFESLKKAREFLNSAIEKDPDWAPLYAGLAEVWIGISQMGYESPETGVPKIFENLNKAIELDPDLAKAHYLNALIAYLAEWDWEKSEKEFLKAIAINPNDAFSRMYYGHLLYILQRPEEAAVQVQLAYELDPLNTIIQVTYTYALLCSDDCEAAMTIAEKALSVDPENFLTSNQLYETAAHCGEFDVAFETYKIDLQVYYRKQLDQDDYKKIEKIFHEQGYFAAYEEILHYYEAAAENGFIGPGVMAIRYMMGNQQDKAMDCLEEAFEIHDPQMPYIAAGGYPFDSLYDNPRFIAILTKMNLPLPDK